MPRQRPLVHRRVWTLRRRVAAAFAAMALLLAAVLGTAAWLLASSYVKRSEETSAVAETADNARLIEAELRAGARPSTRLVDRLTYPPGGSGLLVDRAQKYPAQVAESLGLARHMSPSMASDEGRLTRIDVDGHSLLTVGVRLGAGSAFFELFPLPDLQRTLWVLRLVVIAGAVGVGLAGLAVGEVAGRRMLRPLADLTSVAAAVAQGNLSARLDANADPDLEPLARSFNRTAAALERRVHADARFAGDVSHELRTPLTTMLNSIELLENHRAELPPVVVEPLDLLAEDLQRFRRLVVDLLDISRSDGAAGESTELVTVADLVRRAADAAAGRAVAVVEPAAEGLVMRADKRRLERVVTNLVENAEIHGGGCMAVRVCIRDESVRVEVEDRGSGVALEHRERVFERFSRAVPTRGPGVGLGLAIVAQHVHWHGGRVWVEDAPGGGARFVVQLPSTDVRRPRYA